MNIKSKRAQFTVGILDSNEKRRQHLEVVLRGHKFQFWSADESGAMLKNLPKNPPHVLFLPFQAPGSDVAELAEKVKRVSPETHVIALCPKDEMELAVQLLGGPVDDCVGYPWLDENLLTKSIDRLLERDYYFYENEQLKERLPSLDASGGANVADATRDWVEWLKRLYFCKTYEEAISHYLQLMSLELQDTPIIFFKYLPAHRSLVPTQSYQMEHKKLRGIGVDLKRETGSSTQLLENPSQIPALRKLMLTLFDSTEFGFQNLTVENEVMGVIAYGRDANIDDHSLIGLGQMALTSHLAKLMYYGKFLKSNQVDELTEIFDRHNFLQKLAEEISRSRRIHLPVSLLLVSVDEFDEIESQFGKEEADLLLKLMARIFVKNSRTNDRIGRVGRNEFGILLPHTTQKGAVVKAERLRMIIESADFSKTLKSVSSVTVTIGISEYPTHSLDGDSLLKTCDLALFDAKKTGSNRVALANVPQNFKPDFLVGGSSES